MSNVDTPDPAGEGTETPDPLDTVEGDSRIDGLETEETDETEDEEDEAQ